MKTRTINALISQLMKKNSRTLVSVVGKTYVIAPHPAQKGIEEKSQVKRATKTTVKNYIQLK